MVKEIAKFVKFTYENQQISNFVHNVSDVLRIFYRANIEVNDAASNLIFCVFSAFYPELVDAIEHTRLQELEEQKANKDKEQSKFQIKMLPLTESIVKASKEKFTLFKNSQYMSNRVEELSQFCMINKRIINKMIKTRSHAFANELEGLIKHMPNILDFDNKRAYFKKELQKLKRNSF
jgi:hypothetical protein